MKSLIRNTANLLINLGKPTNLSRCSSLGFRNYCTPSKPEDVAVKPEEAAPVEPPTIITEKNGNITLIGINRPNSRNAINMETAALLTTAIETFEMDDTSSVAVLHGFGGNFCAGYDLKELADPNAQSSAILLRSEGAMGPTRRLIKKPLICAISGYCVAGGMELALMCDLRVMEESAIMGFYNRRFGVPLLDGGTVRLSPLIGMSRALDLVLTGRQVAAKEAGEIGLVNRIVATGTALGQSLNLAASIAKFPQACLQHDRDSLLNAVYNARNKDEALDYEMMSVTKGLLDQAKVGAEKFISGIGKHGKFADLSELEIPDWEKKEIEIEKKNKE